MRSGVALSAVAPSDVVALEPEEGADCVLLTTPMVPAPVGLSLK